MMKLVEIMLFFIIFLAFYHKFIFASESSSSSSSSSGPSTKKVDDNYELESFINEMGKVQKEIEKKYEHLRDGTSGKEDEYLKETTREQARFVFKFLDQDGNNNLDRAELIRFAKLTLSNDTESAETYADVTLHADKNNDKMLNFDEFYQPKVVYGGTSEDDHRNDEKHQHKDGHGYKKDPKIHNEL